MTQLARVETYESAVRFLLDRIDFERIPAVPYRTREYKLDRMRELLRRLGDPHQHLKIIHVAGTKGKGSTAAMLSSIFVAAGYRTGKFTSPHLDRLEERVAIDEMPCSPEELAELVGLIRPVVETMDRAVEWQAANGHPGARGPTYFELTTALAILHFARCSVDVAILEVGMGGRLDSTNVCIPVCCVITSISFDHTKQLGNTLARIAREKAGIIKPGVPVISGVVQDEPRSEIARIAHSRGAPLRQLGDGFSFRYAPPHDADCDDPRGTLDYFDREQGTQLVGLTLGLLGRHQAANAAVALATIGQLQQLGWRVPEEAVRTGLANVRCRTRVEVVCRNPTVIVDAAHNVASIDALLATLDESFTGTHAHRVLVFATTQEKDVRGMLQRLLPRFDQIVFTRYMNNPRGVPPQELLELAGDVESSLIQPTARNWQLASTPAAARTAASRLATSESLVCVTGSFFIAAEMRQQIVSEPVMSAAAPLA